MERCGECLPRGKPLVSHTSVSKLMGFWGFLEHSKFGGSWHFGPSKSRRGGYRVRYASTL